MLCVVLMVAILSFTYRYSGITFTKWIITILIGSLVGKYVVPNTRWVRLRIIIYRPLDQWRGAILIMTLENKTHDHRAYDKFVMSMRNMTISE